MSLAMNVEKIFWETKQKGITSKIQDLSVIDDAKQYFDTKKGNLFDRLVLEGREFGISLVLPRKISTILAPTILAMLRLKPSCL